VASLLFVTAQRISEEKKERGGMYITALVYEYHLGKWGKAWDLRTTLAGRLQVSCLGEFF